MHSKRTTLLYSTIFQVFTQLTGSSKFSAATFHVVLGCMSSTTDMLSILMESPAP